MLRKKEQFTIITPLPYFIPRQLAIDILHSHSEVITLNPLVLDHKPIKAPRDAAADEFYSTWYEIKQRIQYIPGLGKAGSGNISFNGCFHDMPWGLQTHIYAPMNVDMKNRYRIAGNQAGVETAETLEMGLAALGAPADGLYLRDDVEVKCNFAAMGFVKSQIRAASKLMVARIIKTAELLDAGVLQGMIEDGRLRTVNPHDRTSTFGPGIGAAGAGGGGSSSTGLVSPSRSPSIFGGFSANNNNSNNNNNNHNEPGSPRRPSSVMSATRYHVPSLRPTSEQIPKQDHVPTAPYGNATELAVEGSEIHAYEMMGDTRHSQLSQQQPSQSARRSPSLQQSSLGRPSPTFANNNNNNHSNNNSGLSDRDSVLSSQSTRWSETSQSHPSRPGSLSSEAGQHNNYMTTSGAAMSNSTNNNNNNNNNSSIGTAQHSPGLTNKMPKVPEEPRADSETLKKLDPSSAGRQNLPSQKHQQQQQQQGAQPLPYNPAEYAKYDRRSSGKGRQQATRYGQ